MNNKEFNELFSDLDKFRSGKLGWTPVKRIVEKAIDGEGEQGEEGLSYEVYTNGEEFLRFKITTDSYGYNQSISGISFVVEESINVKTFKPV